ncbi:MAG: outer membrane protein assembly factor BamB [Verrucomicrobiales bacterium]|jgi:outer membrane protein assembly factor BamB
MKRIAFLASFAIANFAVAAHEEIRDSFEIAGQTIFVDGPIRYAPADWGDLTFVGSDDGFLYCYDNTTGDEIWKFRGGPSNRKALGAGRLISAWPISGGPVVHENRVYFAAGIWPFMGVFVYALDCETGDIVWVNDRATALWKSAAVTEQRPDRTESEPSFISVTPMGQLSIDEDGNLLVPCGRAQPARFNLQTGELLEFHYGRHKPHEAGEGNLLYPNYDEVVTRTSTAFPPTPSAQQLLKSTGTKNGIAIVLGAADQDLITGLISESPLQVIVIDPSEERIAKLRKTLNDAGVYGPRVSAHVGKIQDFGLPPYFANLIVAVDMRADAALIQSCFEVLRPYGGVACFDSGSLENVDLSGLPGAEPEVGAEIDLLRRTGPLPGSDAWSHEFGNAANTQSTKDALAKSPFAVLWFGGPAAEVHRYYENHRQWAIPKVTGGRLFVEGPRLISAFDAYTGRLLWEWRPQEDDDERWSYEAKGVHLAFEPLAGRTAATEDALYVVSDERIHALDAETGRPLPRFRFEETDDWSGLRVVDDKLVFATADRILAIDRRTGDLKWDFGEMGGSLAIGGGRVFCIKYPWPDRYNNAHLKPESRWMQFIEDAEKIKRRGGGPQLTEQLLVALDLETGAEHWRKVEPVGRSPVRRLIYSDKHDLLLMLGNGAVIQAADGERVWRTNLTDKAVLVGDNVWGYGNLGVIANLSTQTINQQINPITLQTQPFRFSKTGNGCGPMAGGKHILTMRSGSAAYFDLGVEFSSSGGVVNLGAFRSSCQASLIPADGLLVSPNSASGGCTCRYPAATALALVHAPEMEKWGAFGEMELAGPIRKLGINFGAPGDRMAESGVLWLDYPSVGGPSPKVVIETTPTKPEWFRAHVSRVEGKPEYPWVSASGATNLNAARITVGGESEPDRAFGIRVFYLETYEPAGSLNPASVESSLVRSKRGVLEIKFPSDRPVSGVEIIER